MHISFVFLLFSTFYDIIAGDWSSETTESGGSTRYYKKYVPDVNEFTGVMVFLHGAWGNANSVVNQYQVKKYSDMYSFIGIVPDGSPSGCSYCFWNIDKRSGDKRSGVDEVSFIHAVLDEVILQHSVSDSAPKIALGFSNGAGLSLLLGCHNSNDLYVAHVAVKIKDEANFPTTCTNVAPSSPTWNGIGGNDFFLSG